MRFDKCNLFRTYFTTDATRLIVHRHHPPLQIAVLLSHTQELRLQTVDLVRERAHVPRAVDVFAGALVGADGDGIGVWVWGGHWVLDGAFWNTTHHDVELG
jgi:hypothetical protein